MCACIDRRYVGVPNLVFEVIIKTYNSYPEKLIPTIILEVSHTECLGRPDYSHINSVRIHDFTMPPLIPPF